MRLPIVMGVVNPDSGRYPAHRRIYPAFQCEPACFGDFVFQAKVGLVMINRIKKHKLSGSFSFSLGGGPLDPT